MSSDRRENKWHINSEFSLLAQYCFTAFVQRISNSGEIQNTIIAYDKVMNFDIWITALR